MMLPYPRKNSTIGEVVEWFDKEIQSLLGAIAKVNKNFLCYCIAGILRLLYENANCGHTRGDWETFGVYCKEMVGLTWFALCYRCFPCHTGGEDICYMMRCFETADTDFNFCVLI
jgi:hypothetical protein